jgi:hypothetical protein
MKLNILTLALIVGIAGCSTSAQPSAADTPQATPVPETAPAAAPTSAPEGMASPAVEQEANIHCTETDPDPFGQSIAEKYAVTYEEVMTWYCEGESFEDILLAVQTSELADVSVELLLNMKARVGWEQVWNELGIVPEEEP